MTSIGSLWIIYTSPTGRKRLFDTLNSSTPKQTNIYSGIIKIGFQPKCRRIFYLLIDYNGVWRRSWQTSMRKPFGLHLFSTLSTAQPHLYLQSRIQARTAPTLNLYASRMNFRLRYRLSLEKIVLYCPLWACDTTAPLFIHRLCKLRPKTQGAVNARKKDQSNPSWQPKTW